MAYYERMDEAVRYGPVCRRDIRLYSEQEQQIYKYVLENGFITTAETVGRKRTTVGLRSRSNGMGKSC